MVDSASAFRTTRLLLHQEGIFSGISAGSVVYAAVKLAQRMKNGNIVCVLADGGWKYLSTGLWNREYLEIEEEAKGKIWW